MDELMQGFNARTSAAAAMVKNNDGSYSWWGGTGYIGGTGKGSPFTVEYELEPGVYRLSYDATNPREDEAPTTILMPVDKNGTTMPGFDWKYGKDQGQNSTFVVDENYGGFHIGWWHGDRTDFYNIFLEKIS